MSCLISDKLRVSLIRGLMNRDPNPDKLIVSPPPALPAPLGTREGDEELFDRTRELFQASHAKATQAAYAKDWARFEAWCVDRALKPLPPAPEAIALYLAHLAKEGLKASSISRALSGITWACKEAGFEPPRKDPKVTRTLRGILRELGKARNAKAPLLSEHIDAMLAAAPSTLTGRRDRALLALGFTGAFRRSELVALDVADLDFTSTRGLRVQIRKSKTDQEGQGRTIAISASYKKHSAAELVKAWLTEAGIADGAVFRATLHEQLLDRRLTSQMVAIIVKKYAEKLSFDVARFAGHSLRAGFVTSAARAGKTERAIMNQTGHTNVEQVRQYIRNESLFDENASDGIL
jgi:site-specific recombinase XerD